MLIFKIFIFLILLIFPFGQLTRIPLGISELNSLRSFFPAEINFYLQDLVVSGLVVIWLIWHIGKRIPIKKPPLAKPILLFVTVAAISLLINLSHLDLKETVVSSLYLLRWIFYAGVYFVVYEASQHHRLLISKLRTILIFAGSAAAILGLLQYLLYPDLSNLAYLGWDPHRYRVFGTFFDPGFLGLILVLNLILIVGDFLGMAATNCKKIVDRHSLERNHFLKIVTQHPLFTAYCLLFTVCYIALALTYSRASYLAYLMGMGIIAWIKNSSRFFLTVILAGVLTILLLPRPAGSEAVRLEREESLWARVRSWQQSLTIWKDHPLFGVGFNAYRYAQEDYGFLKEDNQENHAGAGVDSSLLFVLATTGILGFLIYLLLLYDILIYHIRKKNLVVLASMGALLIGSWFSNSLFYPWIMLWIWILLGSTSHDVGDPSIPLGRFR